MCQGNPTYRRVPSVHPALAASSAGKSGCGFWLGHGSRSGCSAQTAQIHQEGHPQDLVVFVNRKRATLKILLQPRFVVVGQQRSPIVQGGVRAAVLRVDDHVHQSNCLPAHGIPPAARAHSRQSREWSGPRRSRLAVFPAVRRYGDIGRSNNNHACVLRLGQLPLMPDVATGCLSGSCRYVVCQHFHHSPGTFPPRTPNDERLESGAYRSPSPR